MNCVTKHFKIVDEEIKSVKECRLKKEFKSSEEVKTCTLINYQVMKKLDILLSLF